MLSKHCCALALLLLLLLGSVGAFVPAAAQDDTCGVVDAIDYPINISETLTDRYDDFGLLRPRFGGNHTGIDVAFNHHGDPVRAAATGLVTYSDPNGWDTEKGVVVLKHLFPDGSIYYSVYGHMEQTDTIHFPPLGVCMQRGDIVGVEGWPSRGLPHLHYEIRNFLPDNGGPGYVTENPLIDGWYNPLDFTELWRIRFAPGYVSSTSFTDVPTLPPVIQDDGLSVIATGEALESFTAQGKLLWTVTTEGVVTGLIGLPGNRVVAHTRSGQALTLTNGRYSALWQAPGPDAPVVALGETLVFARPDGGLAAYTPSGESLWTLPGSADFLSVDTLVSSGSEAAISVRTSGGVHLSIVSAAGKTLYSLTLAHAPLIAPILSGGWLVLDDTTLYHIDDENAEPLATLSSPPRRTARLTADLVGNAYLYLGDPASTLLSISATGQIRWRSHAPTPPTALAPLLRTDTGCLLYLLNESGGFSVFNAHTGDLITQRQLYAGGIQNGSPPARLLEPLANNRVRIGAGFLSTVTLDSAALSNGALQTCVLG